jgi:hypothetical protein
MHLVARCQHNVYNHLGLSCWKGGVQQYCAAVQHFILFSSMVSEKAACMCFELQSCAGYSVSVHEMTQKKQLELGLMIDGLAVLLDEHSG